MAEPLEGMDAYYAGVFDLKTAEKRSLERMLANKTRSLASPGARPEYDAILREELERLWQGRIERGELPPLLPEPLEKAS